MQLGGETSCANVIHAAHEAGIQVPRPEQFQKRALGIGTRHHRCGRDTFAGFEFHAHRTIRLDHNPCHRRRRPDRRTQSNR
jgi:hypothetical protein